ncbi:MAG: D-2-hydroxyacid dehydrogenase [Chloroflexota bacterium]
MTQPLTAVVQGQLPASFPRSEFDGRVDFIQVESDASLKTDVKCADILFGWLVPEEVPAATSRLRWIQLPSAGTNHLHHLPVWSSDITITTSSGVHIVPMTEHIFAMLLALIRHIPTFVREQDRAEWERVPTDEFRELRGTTMGIVGWGRIGAGIAHAAAAFGMRVLGVRGSINRVEAIDLAVSAYADAPFLEPVETGLSIVYPPDQLAEMLGESDVVASVLPLTLKTRRLFDGEAFANMKHGSLFLNIGRGGVVDEPALTRALREGKLRGAGLDVFAEEPLPPDSELWGMPQVIITPHVGGDSYRTRDREAAFFAVNLRRYLSGSPLLNVVEREKGY